RPRIETGGVSAPPVPPAKLPIQTGPPPVPTDSAIVASCGNVSMEAIQAARRSDVGSIRAYILVMFSQTIVWVGCPDSAATCTDAGQLMKPSGSPAPVPLMNAMSSYHAMARGNVESKNPA